MRRGKRSRAWVFRRDVMQQRSKSRGEESRLSNTAELSTRLKMKRCQPLLSGLGSEQGPSLDLRCRRLSNSLTLRA